MVKEKYISLYVIEQQFPSQRTKKNFSSLHLIVFREEGYA